MVMVHMCTTIIGVILKHELVCLDIINMRVIINGATFKQ